MIAHNKKTRFYEYEYYEDSAFFYRMFVRGTDNNDYIKQNKISNQYKIYYFSGDVCISSGRDNIIPSIPI